MSAKTTLIVVRHGNTFNSGDTILRVGGATDLPLTEKGIAVSVASNNSGEPALPQQKGEPDNVLQ